MFTGSNIVTFTLAFSTYFTSNLWFWLLTPQGHPRPNLTVPIESSCLLSKKSFGVQPHICHRFQDISNQRILTLTFTLSRSFKVKPNIVTLAVLDIFHVKKYDLNFWPLRVIHGQTWQCQSKASGPVTVFKIFRIRGLWPWPLTSQGHPKWNPWALYIISVGSNIVTLAVLGIFHVKKYDVDFWPSRSSKVKSDGANRKPLGPSALGVQPRITVFEIIISTVNLNPR